VESMGVSDDCPRGSGAVSQRISTTSPLPSRASSPLVQDGIELPSPDSLDDAALHAKLWEVCARSGKRDVYPRGTRTT